MNCLRKRLKEDIFPTSHLVEHTYPLTKGLGSRLSVVLFSYYKIPLCLWMQAGIWRVWHFTEYSADFLQKYVSPYVRSRCFSTAIFGLHRYFIKSRMPHSHLHMLNSDLVVQQKIQLRQARTLEFITPTPRARLSHFFVSDTKINADSHESWLHNIHGNRWRTYLVIHKPFTLVSHYYPLNNPSKQGNKRVQETCISDPLYTPISPLWSA